MVGQQRLIENLTHYEINTFPHSLLLFGDAGSGKHTFICEYISPLLTFPIVDITSEINIETINTIILSSQATIYIIDCDKISTREQNILLKFLEEPTPNAYIILLSTNTNLIIDTVLNRCQIWTMDKYSDEELLQFTQNASLLSIARTPGRVKLFEQVNVVAIQEYLTNNPNTNLTNTEKDDLNWILTELTDSTTISAAGWNEYEYAKYEILAILPTNLQTEVEQLFFNFENAKWDKEKQIDEKEVKKWILNQIITLVSSKIAQDPWNQWPDEISKSDMEDIIMPNMCVILNYYDIPSEKCISDNTKMVDNSQKIKKETWDNIVNNEKAKSGLKIVLIIIWSIIWLLALMVLVFAIKAKLHKDNDEW